MTIIEIKKALYKENPIANLVYIGNEIALYATVLNNGTEVFFEVPTNDMGEANFYPHMDAKYLIRWIEL